MSWNCDDTVRCLAEDRLNELGATDREALGQHLRGCDACRSQVAEDRALDELLCQSLAPTANPTEPLGEDGRRTLAQEVREVISKHPLRSRPRPILRTLKWAAVLLLVVVGTMAATESGRRQLAKLAAVLSETYNVSWDSPSGQFYGAVSDEPFDREAWIEYFAEVDKLKNQGRGRLVGVLETPDFLIYLVEYTLASGKTVRVGGNTVSEAQKEAMHLDEIELLRREGKGRLISQEEGRKGLGSFMIEYELRNGERVTLETWYPPGPQSKRDRIFEELRKLRNLGAGKIMELRSSESGRLSGLVRYTLSDGRKVNLSQVFGHLEPGQRIPEAQ